MIRMADTQTPTLEKEPPLRRNTATPVPAPQTASVPDTADPSLCTRSNMIGRLSLYSVTATAILLAVTGLTTSAWILLPDQYQTILLTPVRWSIIALMASSLTAFTVLFILHRAFVPIRDFSYRPLDGARVHVGLTAYNDELCIGDAVREFKACPDIHKVIVAVTGGIACYKSAELVSRLVQTGVAVRVLMTESAQRFVTPLTFQSLSNSPVITSTWEAHRDHHAQHVALARWCDLMILAPASADIIAKLAAGMCDDVVSLVACGIGTNKPILLAPAMNADMWANPITQRNLTTLKETLGHHTVGPEEGWQACRTTGPGRMSEPQAILAEAVKLLQHGL